MPVLAEQIRAAARERGLGNVSVLVDAVGPEEGEARLNIAEHGDWGVTSLLDLAESEVQADEYWSQRADLSFTRSLMVPVRRFDQLIRAANAQVVHFVKIDVQGLDVEALQSAGDELFRVRAGMLEVPTVTRVRLYEKERHTLTTVLPLLVEWGFETYAIKPNDPACNEVNVYFARQGEDPSRLESELQLPGIALYDGKHFWDLPTHSWTAHIAASEARAENEARREELEARVRAADERLALVEPALQQREARIEQLDAELARMSDDVHGLQAALASTQADAVSRAADLARSDQRVAALDAETARLEARVAQQDERLVEVEQALTAAHESVARLQAERDALEAALLQARSGLAGRLSAGVRATERLVRGRALDEAQKPPHHPAG